jgi:MFS family permease
VFADLTPLRESPQFRRLWWGASLAHIGTNLTVVAVGLQIYDMTGSTSAVGMLGLWAVIPLMVMGLYGGALVDEHDRRKVALIASTVMWLATIGIALQAYLDVSNVYVLYALVAAQAGASSVNSPARNAILPRLVTPGLLASANALNMMAFTIAMMAGPMLGALSVAGLGYGPTYTIDVITFTFALYALFRLPPMPPLTTPGEPTSARGWKGVGQGLRFLRTRRNVRMTFLIDLCAMILASPRVVFPAVGVSLIGGGATTTGAMTTFVAVGGVVASVFSGRVVRLRWQGRAVAWSVAIWGAGVAVFGGVLVSVGHHDSGQVIWWALIVAGLALAACGAADSVSSIFRNTILQAATPDDLRGRLQGVFFVVVTGGPRLGDMLAGVDSSWLGEGWAMVAGGSACVLGVIGLMMWHRGFLKYDARDPLP